MHFMGLTTSLHPCTCVNSSLTVQFPPFKQGSGSHSLMFTLQSFDVKPAGQSHTKSMTPIAVHGASCSQGKELHAVIPSGKH